MLATVTCSARARMELCEVFRSDYAHVRQARPGIKASPYRVIGNDVGDS